MLVVTFLSYVFYMVGVFYYAARIFGIPIAKKRILLLVTAINSFLVYVPIYVTEFRYEQVLMIVFFLVVGIELTLVYKQNIMTTLSALLCFTINLFGMRILILGILSVNLQLPVLTIMNTEGLRVWISALTFGILFPYILVSSRIMIAKIVIYIFQNKEVMRLACALLTTVCVYIFLSIPVIYKELPDIDVQGHYLIKTGGVALVAFVIIMVVLFLYSRLKKASIDYKVTSSEIESENATITAIEEEAITDFFTGFFVRSIGINKLKELLQRREYGYAVYLDIDGLKNVNDELGHEEGDWYIKNVSKQIELVFKKDTIARIGGDEFLVVGNEVEPLDIKEKVQSCFDEIIKLKEKHEKSYDTSISYGLYEFGEDTILTCDEIMDTIDESMYRFKKNRNKERKNNPLRE